MKDIIAIYRACGNEVEPFSQRDLRPNWFNKFRCWDSFYDAFGTIADIYVLWDGDRNALSDYIQSFDANITPLNGRNNAKSMEVAFNLAGAMSQQYRGVYFCEDDWMHKKGAGLIFNEGLNFTVFQNHFITLYDRPHGYRMPQDDVTFHNDYIFKTNSVHWRSAESCMFTFGMTTQMIQDHHSSLVEYCRISKDPVDRQMFRDFYKKGVRLFNPIPGQAAHCITWDLPIDWNK